MVPRPENSMVLKQSGDKGHSVVSAMRIRVRDCGKQVCADTRQSAPRGCEECTYTHDGKRGLLRQMGACTQGSEQLARGSLVLTTRSFLLEDSGKFFNQALRIPRGLIWYMRPNLLKNKE